MILLQSTKQSISAVLAVEGCCKVFTFFLDTDFTDFFLI